MSDETNRPASDPSGDVLSPLGEAEQLSRARAYEAQDRELRPGRLLEAQGWRCAYPCGDGHIGGPMLPGEAFAYIDNHEGIVHVDCLKSGTVPSEGNPWTINGALRGKR
jgi:hypothetical protein